MQDKLNAELSYHTAMMLFAVLFATPEPISLKAIQSKLSIPDSDLQDGLNALKTIIEANTPLILKEAGDKVFFGIKPEYGEYIQAILKIKKQPLSDAAVEVLAIIAYNQPVMKSEIDRIRGVDCEAAIDRLVVEGLVKVIGNLSRAGSPVLLQTTEKFLMTFNLKGLKDLPALTKSA